MSEAEIRTLTTCHGTTMAAIHMSLVRNGYEIKDETNRELVTAFKQVKDEVEAQTLWQVSVIPLDSNSFRFRLRMREVRRGEAQAARDTALEYLEEKRSDYYEIQRQVCG